MTTIMSIRDYDSEVRTVVRLGNWVVINQTYWYKDTTEEEAVKRYKESHGIKD